MLKRWYVKAVVVPWALLSSSEVLAKGSDKWIAPGVEILDDLTAGLVKIGIPLVGIGVVALGIWAGVSGRMEWTRVGMIVAGGVLIAFGVDAVSALLS